MHILLIKATFQNKKSGSVAVGSPATDATMQPGGSIFGGASGSASMFCMANLASRLAFGNYPILNTTMMTTSFVFGSARATMASPGLTYGGTTMAFILVQ